MTRGSRLREGGCEYQTLDPSELYECTTDGRCTPTGILAEWAAADTAGNLAWALPGGEIDDPEPLTIRWADGTEQTVTTTRQVAEWAPG